MGNNQSLPSVEDHDRNPRIFADDRARAHFVRPHVPQSFTYPQVLKLLYDLDVSFPPLSSKSKNNVCRGVCHWLQVDFALKIIRKPADSGTGATMPAVPATGRKREGSPLEADRIKRHASEVNTHTVQNPINSQGSSLPPLQPHIPQHARLPLTGFIGRMTQMFEPSASPPPTVEPVGSSQSQPLVNEVDGNDPDYEYGSQARRLLSIQKLRSSTNWNHRHNTLKAMVPSPRTTWIIDFEFVQLSRNMCAVPVEIAIRALDKKVIANTHVDYNMSILQLHTTLLPWLSPQTDTPSGQNLNICNSTLAKHYGAIGKQRTTGMTITRIQQEIRRQGWNSNTHDLLCWGGGVHRTMFNRIMAGNDAPVVPVPPNMLPAYVGVAGIVRAALVPEYDGQYGLSNLHQALCPGIVRTYHTADEDVQAILDVIDMLLAMPQ